MHVKARCCVVLAVGSVFLLLPAAGSAATRAPNARSAARACAGGRPLRGALGADDVAYVRRFTTCVVRKERAQIGLGYKQSPALSAMVRRALNRFFASGLRAKHEPRRADRVVEQSARTMALKTCPRKGATFSYAYGDTSPPPITPLLTAQGLLRLGGKVLRTRGAVFGVASRSGVTFENHNPRGAMLMWIAVVCH
jgi:hypothetical protein